LQLSRDALSDLELDFELARRRKYYPWEVCCTWIFVHRWLFTARRYASAVCRRLVSVCSSIRLSATRWHCTKTAKRRITNNALR